MFKIIHTQCFNHMVCIISICFHSFIEARSLLPQNRLIFSIQHKHHKTNSQDYITCSRKDTCSPRHMISYKLFNNSIQYILSSIHFNSQVFIVTYYLSTHIYYSTSITFIHIFTISFHCTSLVIHIIYQIIFTHMFFIHHIIAFSLFSFLNA